MNAFRTVTQYRRCLLVDGDFPALCSIREVLISAGFEVHCASGPGEAKRLMARHTYDLLVIDLPPVTSDAAVVDAISLAKQKNPFARAIVLASGEVGALREMVSAGAAEIWHPRHCTVDWLRAQVTAASPGPGVQTQEPTSC